MADVAGKGLASAMISTTFRSSFRAIAGAGLPLDGLTEVFQGDEEFGED